MKRKKNTTVRFHAVRFENFRTATVAKAIQEIGKLCDGNSIDYIFSRRGRIAIAGFNIGNSIPVTFNTYLCERICTFSL